MTLKVVLRHLDTLKLPAKKESDMEYEEFVFFCSNDRKREALALHKIRVFLSELEMEIAVSQKDFCSPYHYYHAVAERITREAFKDKQV